VYRAGITTKLAELKPELNTALLKVIEKDVQSGAYQSSFRVSVGPWLCLPLFCVPAITCCSVRLSEIKTELEQS
jgi:hypothetical protein